MIRERNGRNVGCLLLCMLDRAPQMRFIPIKPFSLLLKTITDSLYLTSALANLHIPQSLPYQLFYISVYLYSISAKGIMIDILWPTAHRFNPTSNNNSTESSSQKGHVYWHISEFNFSWIVVLTGVI